MQSFGARGGWQCMPQRRQPRTLQFQPMSHAYIFWYEIQFDESLTC